jgi:hypothetical protein
MDLFILHNVLENHAYGMAVIAAESLERSGEIFIEQFSTPKSDSTWKCFETRLTLNGNKLLGTAYLEALAGGVTCYPKDTLIREFNRVIEGKTYKLVEGINCPEGLISYVTGGA